MREINFYLLVFGLISIPLIYGYFELTIPTKIIAQNNYKEIKRRYIPSYTFYTEGNTLFWKIDGKIKPEYWLKFQLDHLNPPTINQDVIEEITLIGIDKLKINTKDREWILIFSGNPETDWYVINNF